MTTERCDIQVDSELSEDCQCPMLAKWMIPIADGTERHICEHHAKHIKEDRKANWVVLE